MRTLLLICAAFGLLPAGKLSADFAAEAEALRMASSALTADGDRASLGEAIAAIEQSVIALRSERRRLSEARGFAMAERDEAEERLDPAVRLLMSMRRAPLAGMMEHPQGPQASSRAAIFAATMADDAQQQLIEAQTLQSRIESLQTELQNVATSLADAQNLLNETRNQLTARPASGADGQAPDGIAAALLLANSETLGELTTVLADLELTDGPISNCAGPLPYPATLSPGSALRPDGEGLSITLEAEQIITAPCTSVVRFTAPFPGYGQIVVLEAGPQLYFVLGGLGNIYAEAGAIVTEGTPIGDLAPSEDGDQRTSLYIEVRRDNTAQDIGQWFTSQPQNSEESFP